MNVIRTPFPRWIVAVSCATVVLCETAFAFRAHAPTTTDPIPQFDAVPAASVPTPVFAPILVYHNIRPTPDRVLSETDKQYDVTPEAFDAQLSYLATEGWSTVGFDDLAAALDGKKTLPEKSVVITLDDGRETQFVYALPLLKKHGFTATFFIFTNAVGREGYFTWDQLKGLLADGMAVGAHSRFHPYLTKIADDQELDAEIAGSKATLERGLGVTIDAFAYPFGMHDERVDARVKDAGFVIARGLRHDAVHRPDARYDLGGFITTGDLARFKAILAGKR